MPEIHPVLSADERSFYQRQLPLPELGEEGQLRLKAARLLVVGAGGLGCPALLHLAAAGVGFLRICEPDQLDIHNLHRQPLYEFGQAGQPKGRLARQRLQALNPHLQAEWTPMPFAPERAASLLEDIDLALDCADSLSLTLQLNKACVRQGVPLVSAAVHRWEGQLLSVDPKGAGGCLCCLWPLPPPEPSTCAEAGILGTVPGMMGTLQAQEAIKLLLRLPGDLRAHLLLVDLLAFTMRRLGRSRREDCQVCGSGRVSQELASSTEERRDLAPSADPGMLEVASVDQELQEWRGVLLVDLREEGEPGLAIPSGHQVLRRPLSGLRFPDHGLPAERDLLIVCAHGVRSLWVTARLRALGRERCWSLQGGVEGLRPGPGQA